jgi:fluoride exporter
VSVWIWVAVALLGGGASIARLLIDSAISRRARHGFPLGTLAVNASGALALGLLIGLAVSGQALLIAGTAAVGSYTTFSTWMLETHRLAESERHHHAALNAFASLALGVGAVALGRALGAGV